MINDWKKLTHTTKRLWQKLAAGLDSDPRLKSKGIRTHLLETVRTSERQRELVNDGKSWTLDSNHLADWQGNASAFDIVVGETWLGKIRKIFWGREKWQMAIYERLTNLGLDVGLRSLGYTYGVDYFHFELPRIVQKGPQCYAYSIINALAYHVREWRALPIHELEDKAMSIVDEMGKPYGGNMKLALQKAKDLGIIKGFSKLKVSSFDELAKMDGPIVIAQRFRYGMPKGGSTYYPYIKQSILDKQGIPLHAYAMMYSEQTQEGPVIHCLNSQRDIPEFPIYNINEIVAIYEIEPLD